MGVTLQLRAARGLERHGRRPPQPDACVEQEGDRHALEQRLEPALGVERAYEAPVTQHCRDARRDSSAHEHAPEREAREREVAGLRAVDLDPLAERDPGALARAI